MDDMNKEFLLDENTFEHGPACDQARPSGKGGKCYCYN